MQKKLIRANRIITAATLFWLAETIFFLIRDGWHIEASCAAEHWCQNIVVVGMGVGYVLWRNAADAVCRWAASDIDEKISTDNIMKQLKDTCKN